MIRRRLMKLIFSRCTGGWFPKAFRKTERQRCATKVMPVAVNGCMLSMNSWRCAGYGDAQPLD